MNENNMQVKNKRIETLVSSKCTRIIAQDNPNV